MKKILKLIVLVIVFFISINICHAVENNIKIGPAIPNVKLYLDTPDKDGYIKNMYKLENETTGELLYCIEPGVQLYNGFFKRLDNPYDITSITKEQYDMISRYAFFGYNFPGREDIKWYVVTQYSIWNYLLDGIGEVYFVDEDGQKIEPYNDEIMALQDDVDKAYLVPSFAKGSNEIYEMHIGEELTLTDTNGVLHKFDNNRTEGHPEYRIDGDNLIIKYNSGGYYALHFSKNTNTHDYAYVYFKDGSQVVVSRGYINQPASFAYFKVLYPSFNFQKKSSIPCDLSLAGAEYQIHYKIGDNLIGTYTTDENGQFKVDELYNADYYIIETKAPYGYKLNTEKTYFKINNEDVVLEILEEPIVKKITFKKYLENNNKVLNIEPNAEFQLFKKGNNVPLKTVTTDVYGEISFDLTYGTYILHQTKGAYGYNLMPDHEFTIDDNYLEGRPIELRNSQIMKGIKIIKYLNDADGSFKVESDARFYLYDLTTGLLINELTTDHLGEINLYLPYGTYKLHQIHGKNGYNFIEDYIFTIDDKTPNLYEITLRNEQIVKNIKLIKYLDRYNYTIQLEPDAEFEIYDEINYHLIKTIKTNNQGEVVFSLPLGKYIIHQTKGKNGFKFISDYELIINETTKDLEIIEFHNPEIIKELKIIKYLEDYDNSLRLEENATFELIDALNGSLIANLITNPKGEISLNLPYGSYILRQTKGTKGYNFISDMKININADSSEVIKIILKNKQIIRELKIVKYLENVDYSLSFEENAVFNIINKLTNKVYATLKTNNSGEASIKLPYGIYLLRQISGTNGYHFIEDTEIVVDEDSPNVILKNLKNKQIEKEIIIKKFLENIDNSITVEKNAIFELIDAKTKKVIGTYTTDKYGKIKLRLTYGKYILKQIKGETGYDFIPNQELIINDDTPNKYMITLKNPQIEKNISIIKYLENFNGHKLLERNASFELINTETKEVIKIITTDSDGKINLKLPYGAYTLHQIKGMVGYHYIPDYHFTIDDSTPDTLNIKLINKQIIKEIKITKYLANEDGTNFLEKDAKFYLIDAKTNKVINIICTNKYGEIMLKLPYGDYIIHQIKGASGYKFTEDIELSIDDFSKYHDNLIIYDKQITGTLKIMKKDILDQNLILRPALFKIKNKDTLEYIEIDGKNIWETLNGYLSIYNIPYGNYILEEITPPSNYKILKNLEFSIKNDNETINIEVYNELMRGNIIIEKLDAYTKKPLAGVIFGLYNSSYELIGEYTTNEMGLININDLEIGTYYLQEILTKEDYELTNDLIMVEVKDGITSPLTINNRHKITVPKTGSKEFLITIIISTLILLFGVYICNYAKKTN